ncbi:hypothetical protein [Schleiferilactobacillus harbinensis]|jgi:uncharacterized lipoprotein YehR (DUF1307 family)|uniref:hypothetical protein n=1 Tax=Schleiferilactobacillus harbinensis TaxID=304207 RepID=UPI001170B314|nr:hypothetical protein [Schleiferilactobacillus harbinensis]GEK05593.1 hypothetical protein LHA01_08320 [Schleiferilactobacillus harbinensis]
MKNNLNANDAKIQEDVKREQLVQAIAEAVVKLPGREIKTKEEFQKWLEDDSNW